VLVGAEVTLRELRVSDAAALCAMLTSEEVSRFISLPATTVADFEQFIGWGHREREAGRYACFAVVLHDRDSPIGIVQVRQLESGFRTAEWGFAIGSSYWGSGIFEAAATLVLDFTFEVLGVHRLEARAAVRNGRGNGALRKIGAICEAIVRRSFERKGEYLDQHLWSILESDWQDRRPRRGFTIN
jgi:ribosomal-protein-alanine N-acetyltransferase